MKFKINSAQLKHRIIIQYATNGKDEDSKPKLEWQEKFNTRAKIMNVRGSEYIQALGENSKVEKTFYFRASKSHVVTEDDRIIYNGVVYDIEYANNIEEEGLFYEVKCKRCK
ncbi:MAG: phage head closure protein [Clostridium sp.]